MTASDALSHELDVSYASSGHYLINELVVCVPAVYLGSAEVSMLAFLAYFRINNLRWLDGPCGFEPRPAHRYFLQTVSVGCSGLVT
jgi:hypothetical protein